MLPKLAAFVLSVFLVLIALGWQLWQLWQVQAGAFLDDAALTLKVVTSQSSELGLLQIADQHLFGNPADRPAAEPEKPAVLPATDLKLVLVGAITDSNPDRASALIQAEKDTRRYYVGDDIGGQAILQEVSSDSVVLKRGNRLEKLEFPKGGDMNPEAREALSKLTGASQPPVTQVPPPAPARPITPQQNTASGTGQQDGAVKNPDKPAERTGRPLRDRLQKRPKTIQQPPGG